MTLEGARNAVRVKVPNDDLTVRAAASQQVAPAIEGAHSHVTILDLGLEHLRELRVQLERVDELGLDEIDRRYLRVLAEVYEGGPAGLEAIAATMGDDAGTLEDVVEPYLLQIGFLARTPRGRKLTAAGEGWVASPGSD